MGRTTQELVETLSENVGNTGTVDSPPNFFESNIMDNSVHVLVDEENIGQFYRTVRTQGIETEWVSRYGEKDGALAGWVSWE